MGKKTDKGTHIGRAGDMEQRKDQQTQMQQRANRRATVRAQRGKPPIRKNAK
jgi:hypothetical protein